MSVSSRPEDGEKAISFKKLNIDEFFVTYMFFCINKKGLDEMRNH